MNELNVKRKFLSEDIFYSDVLRVLKSKPAFKYENGVKTEERVATFLEVVDLTSFDKYQIKVPIGYEIKEPIDINVNDFIDFEASLYVRNNRIYWSLKSNGIRLEQ